MSLLVLKNSSNNAWIGENSWISLLPWLNPHHKETLYNSHIRFHYLGILAFLATYFYHLLEHRHPTTILIILSTHKHTHTHTHTHIVHSIVMNTRTILSSIMLRTLELLLSPHPNKPWNQLWM